jgi:hypothetical protein
MARDGVTLRGPPVHDAVGREALAIPPPLNSLSKRRDFYWRAVICRVGMPSSSTYQSPMIILIAGNTSCRSE